MYDESSRLKPKLRNRDQLCSYTDSELSVGAKRRATSDPLAGFDESRPGRAQSGPRRRKTESYNQCFDFILFRF